MFDRLTDKYANELKNYQLVCFYCGVMLDPINVNKKCKANLEQVPADCKKINLKKQKNKVLINFKKSRDFARKYQMIDTTKQENTFSVSQNLMAK